MLSVAATLAASRNYDAGWRRIKWGGAIRSGGKASIAQPSACERAARVASIWMVASLMLLILVGVCTAAEVPVVAAAHTGKLPGMISGLLLLALLGYSVYVYAAPLLKDRDRSLGWALAILSVVAIVKIALLPLFDGY